MEGFTVTKGGADIRCIAGRGALKAIDEKGKCFVLADSQCHKQHKGKLRVRQAGRYLLRPESDQKDVALVARVADKLYAADADSDTALIAFGGGFVLDVAAAAALMYKGGLELIYAPSTPLAAFFGASGRFELNLGGKTGCLGAAKVPKSVLCDTSVIATVPEREALSGLGAALALASASSPLLGYLEGNYERLLRLEQEPLAEALAMAMPVSAREAELPGGTLAYAFLQSGEYSLSYGEALLYGIYFESVIAEKFTGKMSDYAERAKKCVLDFLRKIPGLSGSYSLYTAAAGGRKNTSAGVALTVSDGSETLSRLIIPHRDFNKLLEECEYDPEKRE